MHRDVEKAYVRDQESESAVGAPVIRMNHESADFGRTIVRKSNGQNGVMKVSIHGLRVFLLADHVQVDVRRIAPAELRHDHRGADGLTELEVAQQKYELPVAASQLAPEAAFRVIEQRRDVGPVVRQVDGVQKAREAQQLLLVALYGSADVVGEHLPFLITHREAAAVHERRAHRATNTKETAAGPTTKASALRLSSQVWTRSRADSRPVAGDARCGPHAARRIVSAHFRDNGGARVPILALSSR
jgi:hypothetical protein